MMKQLLIFSFLFFSISISHAQDKPGTSFAGQVKGDPAVCPQSSNYLTPVEVNNLVTQILDKYHIKNRYIIKACPQVDNCQAVLFRGKPYILYNPEFLSKVKKLNFTQASLPGIDNKDWETLTILAHELGHHINNHLLNPLPDAKQRDMELEADETAGFIIYLLGGTLIQAQGAYNDPSVSAEGDYEHPPRKQRLDAIEAGYNDAAKNYPKAIVVNPVTTLVTENVNTVTDIDGNIYRAVKIGDQVWMAENLNVSHFRNGDLIPEVKSEEEWKRYGKEEKPAWCYYDNDPVNNKKYGKLYNWYAVNDLRGLAPSLCRIPSDEEWTKLTVFLGEAEAGTKMKTIYEWEDNKSNYMAGTNISGFAGLPGGHRVWDFDYVGRTGFWWSSTEQFTAIKNRFLSCNFGDLKKDISNKGDGLSVRCLRN